MEKFKPVLKFCGIYIVTVIALVVMDMFYRAMIDVFGITVPKSAFDTVIAESFILVSVIVAWKYGLIDLPLEFKNGRDTLSKNALSLFAGVLWVVVIKFLQYIHIPDNVDFNVDNLENLSFEIYTSNFIEIYLINII